MEPVGGREFPKIAGVSPGFGALFEDRWPDDHAAEGVGSSAVICDYDCGSGHGGMKMTMVGSEA